MGESDLFYIVRFFVSSATSLLLALIVLCVKTPGKEMFLRARLAKILLSVALVELGLPLSLVSLIRVTPSNICYYFLSDSIAYMMLMAAPVLLATKAAARALAGYAALGVSSIVFLECHFLSSYVFAGRWGASLTAVFFLLSAASLVSVAAAYVRMRKSGGERPGWVPDMYFAVITGTVVYYQLLLPLFPGLDNYATYLVMKVLFVVSGTVFVVWFFEYSARLRGTALRTGSPAREPAQERTLSDEDAADLERKLGKWVEEKHFLEQDEGIGLVAAQLGTDLKTLRTYFRTRMPSDFRTWRISLRIEFAKERLREDPEISVNRLSEMSGFATRSNFYHYFKKITGMTPVEYRELLADDAGNPNS